MKKVFVVFLFIFSTVSTFAQSEGESVKPIGGITLYRNVSLAAIEQNNYLDVIVKFKAAELGDYFTNGVKVVVVDNNTGKKIYRKRFSKSYLYVFSDGIFCTVSGTVCVFLSGAQPRCERLYNMPAYGTDNFGKRGQKA